VAADREMPLTEHLRELRSRIIRSIVAVLVCTFLSFGLLYEVMKQVLVAPLDALDPDTKNVFARYNPVVRRLRPFLTREGQTEPLRLHAMRVTEVFVVKFKIALLTGFILSAPYVFYQAWAFVGAGLLERERRAILRYLPLSLGLFLAGLAFAYFVAVPVALLYLVSVDPEIKMVLMYGPYFGLMVVMLGMFGLAFQMPLVAMVLATLGILPARTLAGKRR